MTTTWVPVIPSAESFGARLRILRLASDDASVKEMASRCGVPPATWRTWEKGASPHNMAAVVDAIQDATGASRDWLMWGVGPAEAPTVDDGKGAEISSGMVLALGAAA